MHTLSTNDVYKLAKYLTNTTGTTINDKYEKPSDGYMVSVVDGPTYQAEDPAPLKEIMDFIKSNAVKDSYFGSWKDSATGKVYIDISANFEDKETALELAGIWNQIAIWDIKNNCEIRLANQK